MGANGNGQRSTPDGVLVARMARGDAAALRELQARYRATAYAAAYGVLIDPEDAEAVVAQAFDQAWREAAQFDPGRQSVFTWLAAITRSLARSTLEGRHWAERPAPAGSPRPRMTDDGGTTMLRKLAVILIPLAVPAVMAAQTPSIPNAHASDTAKSKVAAHSQGSAHRATQVRGSVVGLDDHRPAWIAVPPATRAVPQGGGAATPAIPPATRPPQPATPATPPGKPTNPGQSGNSHRP